MNEPQSPSSDSLFLLPQTEKKWKGHPNLRRRPHSPNLGRGRLQRQIARAFAASGPVMSTSAIYDWCFACRPKMRLSRLNRRRVWQLLTQIADPIRQVRPQRTPAQIRPLPRISQS